MNSKINIGFDFDNCLSTDIVQLYCANLIIRGFNVFIITKRYRCYKIIEQNRNKDIMYLALNLGIKDENICYTNMRSKVNSILVYKIKLFIDDCIFNVIDINKIGNCKALLFKYDSNFIIEAEKYLKVIDLDNLT